MSLYKYAKTLVELKKERDRTKHVAAYMPAAGAAAAAAGTAASEYAKKTGKPQMVGSATKIKKIDQRQYHLQRYRTADAKAAFRKKVGRAALGSAIVGGLTGAAAKHLTQASADAQYSYRRNSAK